jgi:hypothetical protein
VARYPWGWFAAAVAALASLYLWGMREPATAQPRAPEPAARWEYKVLVPSEDARELEKTLNKLAEEGWELGFTIPSVSGKTGGAGAQLHTLTWSLDTKVRLILKRPKR